MKQVKFKIKLLATHTRSFYCYTIKRTGLGTVYDYTSIRNLSWKLIRSLLKEDYNA